VETVDGSGKVTARWLAFTVDCALAAGTVIQFGVTASRQGAVSTYGFVAPLKPQNRTEMLFNAFVKDNTNKVHDSAISVTALTMDIVGVQLLQVTPSNCIPGAKTSLTVQFSLQRLNVASTAVVIVFPKNTWAKSTTFSSTYLEEVTLDAASAAKYTASWQDANVADEDILVIAPLDPTKGFTEGVTTVTLLNVNNPLRADWYDGAHNPNGNYHGQWQFRRVEYVKNVPFVTRTAGGQIPATATRWLQDALATVQHVHFPIVASTEWLERSRLAANNIHFNASQTKRRTRSFYSYTLPTADATNYLPATMFLNYPYEATFATINKDYFSDISVLPPLLRPTNAVTGIQNLSVVPSNRTEGAANVTLDISFVTCAPIKNHGRIEIAFATSNFHDPMVRQVVASGLNNEVGSPEAPYTEPTVNQFNYNPFQNSTAVRDGFPISVVINGRNQSAWWNPVAVPFPATLTPGTKSATQWGVLEIYFSNVSN
jgi:hypothetical protein